MFPKGSELLYSLDNSNNRKQATTTLCLRLHCIKFKVSGKCRFSSSLLEVETSISRDHHHETDSKNHHAEIISEDEQTPALPMDEDMEDILEHIEEDVDLPDEEDEDEDLEEVETDVIGTIQPKKEGGGGDEEIEIENKLLNLPLNLPLPLPTLNSNGLQSSPSTNNTNPGPLPKLPPLPPLPPPLLNLEFLKVKEKLFLWNFCLVFIPKIHIGKQLQENRPFDF